MKTILSPKYFLMVAAISLIVASCKKESVTYPSVVVNDPSAVATPFAVIQDYPATDTLPHLMLATIEHQNVVLSNGSSENNAADAVVSFSFYANSAGMLPAGTYTFSNSSTPAPFTFTDGMLKSANLTGGTSELNLSITGGAVFVTHTITGYEISFVCDLSTGDKLNGVYNGTADILDATPSKK
jgi:hypothetical protein